MDWGWRCGPSTPGGNWFMRDMVLKAVRAHPFWVMGLWLRRLPNVIFGLGPRYAPGGIYVSPIWWPRSVQDLNQLIMLLDQALLAAMGLVALWWQRRAWRHWLPLFGVLGYVVITHALLFAQARFTSPAVVLWAPPIGVAAGAWLGRKRTAVPGALSS